MLENGANPTITNQKGHDAVFEAELNDKTEVVEWVLKEGGEGLEEGVAGDNGEGVGEDEGEEDEMDEEGEGSEEKTTESEHGVEGLDLSALKSALEKDN